MKTRDVDVEIYSCRLSMVEERPPPLQVTDRSFTTVAAIGMPSTSTRTQVPSCPARRECPGLPGFHVSRRACRQSDGGDAVLAARGEPHNRLRQRPEGHRSANVFGRRCRA